MEQFKTDPHTGLRYELQGEYYVIAGDEEAEPTLVGIWGQKHLRFLRKTRPVTYTNLLTTGMLSCFGRLGFEEAGIVFGID